MATFSERFKQLRMERRLTQDSLAEIFFLNKSSISRYESGKQIPEPQTLQKFADFFEVSLDYLMGKSDIRKIADAMHKQPHLSKKDKVSYDEFMEVAKAFFMDASEEDREAITRDISNLYWESKQINKQKYAPRNKKNNL